MLSLEEVGILDVSTSLELLEVSSLLDWEEEVSRLSLEDEESLAPFPPQEARRIVKAKQEKAILCAFIAQMVQWPRSPMLGL